MSSRQYSDSLRVGILLALTGGFLDAYTYISRGNVFANAQTGNMVMLGINFMEGNFRGIINYIIPIIAFAIGVLLAEVIRTKLSKSEKLHWRQAVLAIEIILLISVAFIPFDYVANTIISFICAMQVESFRKFHGNAYATTMCTGNLRSGMDALSVYLRERKPDQLRQAMHYFGIILFFTLGAGAGGVLTKYYGLHMIWLSCLLLLSVCLLMSAEE